ncbi:hypothetical protein QE152_g14142 [Popillia japonica]|uniref:Uncharacterized protein n=1 Tax=Popillia japonica TaxID=7064 RepID=A0AAW1L8V9_POPJA
MKQSLTKFLKYVNDENASGDVSQLKLKVRLEKIEEIWDKFEIVQTEIENSNSSEVDSHAEYREEFEENYYKAVGKARQIIDNSERNAEQLTN